MVAVASPRSRGDIVAFLVLVAVAVAMGERSIFHRPDLSRAAGFLFGDAGHALLMAREVLQGARLYADVAWQYGFASVYIYAAVATLAGNTPLVFAEFLLVWSVVDLVLFYALVRRLLPPGLSFFVTACGALPLLLVPGALLGGFVNNYYVPIERALMLAGALVWQPPAVRGAGRGVALGLLIGALQLVRFGVGVALGAAIVLIDVVTVVVTRGEVRGWLSAEASVVAAAAVVEAARVATAIAFLPGQVARDVIWPSYVLRGYAGASRYPGWHGWAMALGQYLNPVTSIVLGALALMVFARRRPGLRPDEYRQVILPAFFLIGAIGLFRSEWHYFQAAWLLTPAAAVAIGRWRWLRPAAALAWLPPLALVVVNLFKPMLPGSTTITVADGWTLTVGADVAPRVTGIVSALRASPSRHVIFYPYLGGFNVALGLPLVGREAAVMPGFIRPYEENQLIDDYARADTLVTCRQPQQWSDRHLFGADMPSVIRDAVEARAGSTAWRDEDCRVVRLSR